MIKKIVEVNLFIKHLLKVKSNKYFQLDKKKKPTWIKIHL